MTKCKDCGVMFACPKCNEEISQADIEYGPKLKPIDVKKQHTRYLCIKCGDDYQEHQTIIFDDRDRCICMNCWPQLKKVEIK